MKPILPFLLVAACFITGCSKQGPSIDEQLPPGTFNLNTIVADKYGNSVDMAGDWAVFQDPYGTTFTNYIHYDQESETFFSVLDNVSFMLEYGQHHRTLPVYEDGVVNQQSGIFLLRTVNRIIYKDGKIHPDYRDCYILHNAAYGEPKPIVVIDSDTLTFEDLPDSRLRRIKSFMNE